MLSRRAEQRLNNRVVRCGNDLAVVQGRQVSPHAFSTKCKDWLPAGLVRDGENSRVIQYHQVKESEEIEALSETRKGDSQKAKCRLV